MKQPTPTIVLTGGGSGGHITPLLSLARELKALEPGCQITYIGHKGDNFDSLKLSSKDFDFTAFVNGGKFRRYHGESFLSHLLDFKTLALNARDFFRVAGSVFAAISILRRIKPDVVFSKGGFIAVPVCLAAKILRIPIVTHDSDSVPGLANRIVGRWASVNATGMPTKYYSYPESKKVFVGIPISADIKKATPAMQKELKESLGLPPNSLVLLAAGGGNGSRTINELVISIAPSLLSSNLALHILHLTGRRHEQDVTRGYQDTLPKAELSRVKALGFTPKFYDFTAAADLIITRAGATALAEFAAAAKACVVIPSPFLAGGHQLKNADALAANDAAVIVQNDVTPEELLVVISELLNNQERRHELASNLHKSVKPDAAQKLAIIILAAANHQKRA